MQFRKDSGQVATERIASHIENGSWWEFRRVSLKLAVVPLQAHELGKGKAMIKNLPIRA